MNISNELKQWKKSGSFIEIRQHRIFIQETAPSTECILCIHGFPTSSYDWQKLWPALSNKYQLLALDLLGFGFSDKPLKHQYTIAEQVDLIIDLLQQKNVKTVHILAHDYGTIVAQELLARQIDNQLPSIIQIKSVTFLNGALFPEMHRPRLIQKLLLSPLGFLISHLFNKKRFKIAFSEVFGKLTQPSSQEIEDFWYLIQFNKGNKINHLLMNYFNERKVFRDRWVTAIQNTHIPIALINGLADPVSGLHLVERAKYDLPQASIFELPEIGHYPQIEASEETIQHFLSFLNKIT